MATKKIGSAGKFGARFGLKVRARFAKIDKIRQKKQQCPYCRKFSAKRVGVGIFICKSCDSQFTGKAYTVA